MTVEEFLGHFDAVKSAGAGSWMVRCSNHSDRNPSLSIGLGDDDRILLNCHAGCSTEDIVAAAGLSMADLFAGDPSGNGKKEITNTYDYVDEGGELLFQVCRFSPKAFRQRRPDGDGGWEWKLGKTRRVLYRLPKVLEAANAGDKVCVVEGERDVHALEGAGVAATCNPGGVGKWRDEYSEALRGARVAVIADRDEPGRKHAQEVARSLDNVAAEVQIFEPAEGKDISDHLAAGKALGELVKVEREPAKVKPEREVTTLTVEDILKAAGVDDAGGIESPKDLLAALKGGAKVADRLVEMVREAGVQLFHDENRIAYAMVEIDGHTETHRVASREFSLYVRQLYHEQAESVLPTQARKDAEGLLEAQAVFEGVTLPVHMRVAGDSGAIYVDLGDDQWRAIRITAQGWEVLAQHPVRFRRTGGMAPLPTPLPGGSLDELCNLLNLEADTDRRLVIAWLLGAARPGAPYAVLELTGEEGTAKSTAAKALRAMIDPSSTPLRRCPTKSDDLFVSANASWVAAFDNVSGVQQWLSDDLCRLATGGGQSKRELFTDEGEHLIDVRRPVILNGIEEIATKGDLLRRTLRVELPLIEEEGRLTEDEFWADFNGIHPRLLGALCDALSCALRRVGGVKIERKPSMADLALWVTAAEPALGWADGAFLDAYEGRRNEAHEIVIESELAGPHIRRLCDAGFEGVAGAMLAELDEMVDGNTRRRTEWPKSPQGLVGVLKRLSPALRKLGFTVDHGRHTALGTPWVLGKKEAGS